MRTDDMFNHLTNDDVRLMTRTVAAVAVVVTAWLSLVDPWLAVPTFVIVVIAGLLARRANQLP